MPSLEVEKQIIDLFTKPNEFRIRTAHNGYVITVKSEYEYVSFSGYSTLMGMMKVAELLGCNEGDEVDRWKSRGCDTCDYGSEYEVSWRFWRS